MSNWTENQKKAIYERGKNIIVSAGAGSGKTAVLSERVLEYVKSGINIDDLLILTFTNLAATEMKDRIRNKLSKYPELKGQLERIDLSYITTFDAFAMSLVKKYNQVLNISDRLTIIDSSIISLKRRELLTNILDNYYASNDNLFNKLINDFCLKDDQEIFKAIIFLNDRLDIKYDKIKYLKSYLSNYFNDDYINKLYQEYVALIYNKIKNISNQINNLSNFSDEKYILKLKDYFYNLFNETEYFRIKSIVESMEKMPFLPRNSPEEAKNIKEVIKNDLDDIKKLCKYKNEDDVKNSYINTKDYIDIIIEIIVKLDEELNDFKKKNNAYEFIDIAKMAINILESNEDIRLELKAKFKEILIDEYQDTNDIQDKFISMITNNNVYMVGDIKQSIYRFRNANPNLFKEKYEEYSCGNNGLKIDLIQNFRSRNNVISGVNLIFNGLMNSRIGGADYFVSHQMVYGNKNYDNVNIADYNMEILNYGVSSDTKFKKNEIEIFTIANDIKNKISDGYIIMDKNTNQARKVQYGDFVILLDRSKDFNLYKKIMEYLNIPITIMRDQTVSDSEDLMIIKNIYNMIILIYNKSIKDNYVSFVYSFMSIARSYLFEMKDDEIFEIIAKRKFAETRIYEICYDLASGVDENNNRDFYQKIIESFEFYDKLVRVGNIKKHLITLDSIGKIVLSTNGLGYTPFMFCNYLNDVEDNKLDINLALNKDNNNSVKVMTIHASKGLEYPICYYAGLDEKFNTKELKAKFNFNNKYGFVIPFLDASVDNLQNNFVKNLLENNYIEEEIAEKIRLFYVSLTRAREKMIFVTSLNENYSAYKVDGVVDDETRLNYQSFTDMLDSIYASLRSYIKDVNLKNIGLTKQYNYLQLANTLNSNEVGKVLKVNEVKFDHNEIIDNRFSKRINTLQTNDDRKRIKLGLDMHYLMEIADLRNPTYDGLSVFQKEVVEGFIKTGLIDKADKIYKELEFIDFDDEKRHGIIDLLIIYKDHAAIVDYKLKNVLDDAYKSQVNGYKKYIEKITGLKTDTYLYSLLDKKLFTI